MTTPAPTPHAASIQFRDWGYRHASRNHFAVRKLNLTINAGERVLLLGASASTDYFDYKITSTRFTAVSKVDISGCPAGSKWSVSASAKGVFTKELALYRSAPKDTNCVKLTPDYKNLGRAR